MGFIKYSVVELGVAEDVPGWVKQAQESTEVTSTEVVKKEDEPTANIKAEEQKEVSTKD